MSRSHTTGWRRPLLSALSLAFGAVLVALMPRLVGANWSAVWHSLSGLDPGTLVLLFGLWALGLWAYTYVLTGSLPGLGHGRAFMLNAAGSAVSDLLPLGGAAGVAVTFTMARTWGFSNAAVTVSTLVSGVWNIFGRLLLPAVGIGALLLVGQAPDRRLAFAAGTAALLLLAVALLLAGSLRWEWAARTLDAWLERLAGRLPRRPARLLRALGGSLLRIRELTLDVLRESWLFLTLGMTGYLLLQGVLFHACMWAVGDTLRLAETIAVFALNRALTSVVLTPGGTGVTETGTAALLVYFGLDAPAAAASVLLYSFFTFLIEIPVGGVVWAYWLGRRAGKLTDS
ncbi:lysylphosphatidylglycerol synthase domain-containing protein [Actinocorallia sp. B10E7]|uniref:lysylphosphatidylglycerol synthase domain-containing protein n=1 Tax=Actinocorallia sp. B10E7 TaxID=3153558 RepID=UPI00325F7F87